MSLKHDFIFALFTLAIVTLGWQLYESRQTISNLEETLDYITTPANELVVVIDENLKSKQDRTRIKIEELIDQYNYDHYLTYAELQETARLVVKYSERYEVPVDLVIAIMTSESAFNPVAISEVGAEGLMQVMPGTAADIARELRLDTFDLFTLDNNIRFGTYYLRKAMKEFSDLELVIRAYNTGIENVKRITNGKGEYREETVNYHTKVFSIYQYLKF